MKAEKRYATRYLIPLEVAIYVQLVVLAVAGSWPESALANVLLLRGENLSWSLIVGSVGVAGLMVSIAEWVAGKHWANGQLRKALTARKWLALLAAILWSYALYTMLEAPQGWRMVDVVLEAVPMGLLSLWSWWANYRTECLLDPSLKTDRLEQAIGTKRSCW